MTSEGPFELLVRIEGRIRAALRSACKAAGDPSLAEDAWSDVVLERIHRVCELYNPAKSPSIDGYVTQTMKLYTYKWACRQRKFVTGRLPRGNSVGLEDFVVAQEHGSVVDALTASDILSKVSSYDAWLLRAHLVEGYTFAEMRAAMGAKRGVARTEFNKALRRAKEIFAAE